MKPVISYYGGKQRMASKIVPLIPKHTVYVEPFCGGATILFAKPWPDVSNTDHYREVINDTDGRLINFYRCLQDKDKNEQLIHRLQLTLYSRREHRDAKDLDSGSDVDRAVKYYVNVMQSFSNKLNAGWRTSVFGRNEGATWANKVAGLPDYLDRMSAVRIDNEDALKVIERWDSPQTFFYCDPPYPGAAQGHYGGYTQNDFQALVDTLKNCKGSFLLSCYDNACVPKEWERFDFKASISSSCKGQSGKGRDKSRAATTAELGNRERTEVVWRRLNTVPVRSEIQKLYDSGKFDCFEGTKK